MAVSIQDQVTVDVTNNTIDGMAYGAVFYNTTTSNPITLDDSNTIENSVITRRKTKTPSALISVIQNGSLPKPGKF